MKMPKPKQCLEFMRADLPDFTFLLLTTHICACAEHARIGRHDLVLTPNPKAAAGRSIFGRQFSAPALCVVFANPGRPVAKSGNPKREPRRCRPTQSR